MDNERRLRYMEYLQRESCERHHTQDEDAYQYELLKAGDIRAGEATRQMLSSGLTGRISTNPLRNAKYIFVAGAALASRAAMSAGLENERANNISDFYILKMDNLATVEQVQELHVEMMEFFAKEVAALDKKRVYSRDVTRALDFIYEHLYQNITAAEIADAIGLSRSYFSTVFKSEVGCGVSEYVTSKRIEAAKNMLRYSDIPYAEISSTLAFNSQSHFIHVFKRYVGVTPGQYRRRG